jgi:hypothetical protein
MHCMISLRRLLVHPPCQGTPHQVPVASVAAYRSAHAKNRPLLHAGDSPHALLLLLQVQCPMRSAVALGGVDAAAAAVADTSVAAAGRAAAAHVVAGAVAGAAAGAAVAAAGVTAAGVAAAPLGP